MHFLCANTILNKIKKYVQIHVYYIIPGRYFFCFGLYQKALILFRYCTYVIPGLALLKVGGRMVYSTCSMNPVENEAVVAEVIYEV